MIKRPPLVFLSFAWQGFNWRGFVKDAFINAMYQDNFV